MALKPTTSLKTLALAFGIAALGLPAAAQQPQGQAPQTKRGNETLKKYCTGDYLNYCGNLAPEDPALDACFEKNWKQLSENCRRAIDAYQATQGAKGNKRG